MWDIKLKLTDTDKQQHSDYLREGGGWKRVKGAKYMVKEDDLTLGGGRTVQSHIMYHRNVHLKPI